jgi:signal peptidase I
MKMKNKKITPIIIGVFIGIVIKLFIFDIVIVSGNSMQPTLKNGDTLFINKLAYGIKNPLKPSLICQWSKPKKNDIVIYMHNNRQVVKRCCGVSNEVLEYSSNSSYSLSVGEKSYPLTEEQFQRIKYDHQVPTNTILALGDNSAVSVDSRNYGFIPVQNIFGKVLCK